jgi:threonine/homoserine/homoserine lactone efflux protein
MWLGARNPIASQEKSSARHAFIRGVLVNLLNPKSVLFAAAVLVVVFPSDLSARDIALVVANHLAVELAFYSVFAFAISSRAVSTRYLRAKVVLDRIAAMVLSALGLRLLVCR